MREQTAAFTGLRSQKLPFGADENHPDCLRLTELIRLYIVKFIKQKQVYRFLSGMATGADQICARIVLDLKAQFDISLEAAISCIEQEKKWPQKYKDEYKRLLSLCDYCHYVSNARYSSACMNERNKYMVSQADFLLSIWDGSSGGTKNTITYGLQKGIPIVVINPVTFEVKWGKGT